MTFLKNKKNYLASFGAMFLLVAFVMVGCQKDGGVDLVKNDQVDGLPQLEQMVQRTEKHFLKEFEVKNEEGKKIATVEAYGSDKEMEKAIDEIKLSISGEKPVDLNGQNENSGKQQPTDFDSESINFVIKDVSQDILDKGYISFNVDVRNAPSLQMASFKHELVSGGNENWRIHKAQAVGNSNLHWVGHYLSPNCSTHTNYDYYLDLCNVCSSYQGPPFALSASPRYKWKVIVTPQGVSYTVTMFISNCYYQNASTCNPPVTQLRQTASQSISQFVANELTLLGKDAAELFINNQKEVAQLGEDLEVQNALDNFWNVNQALIENAFDGANTTLVNETHIEAAVNLLSVVEQKVSSKELSHAVAQIKSQLYILEGKNLLDGLRTFDKLDFLLDK